MFISCCCFFFTSIALACPLGGHTLTSVVSSKGRPMLTQGKNKTKGKRKLIESNNEDKKDDTRGYFTWNLELERVLADVLRDQSNLGNKSDGAWKIVAYNVALSIVTFLCPHVCLETNCRDQVQEPMSQ